MSLKNTKNLLIIGAVVIAVLAGTVLLGNYTNILSTGSQPKTCQATKGAICAASQAFFAENAEGECARKAEFGAVAKTCPLDPTRPCCAQEGTPGCCPKTCPPDCTKPCCAEAKPDCCPKICPPDCTKPCCAGEAAPACCPNTEVTAAATGCCPEIVTE